MPDWLRTLVWDGSTLLVLALVILVQTYRAPDRADH